MNDASKPSPAPVTRNARGRPSNATDPDGAAATGAGAGVAGTNVTGANATEANVTGDSDAEGYAVLRSWVGLQTHGLGALLREYPGLESALHASEARLAELPPATQRVLKAARDAWPRPRPATRALFDPARRAAPGDFPSPSSSPSSSPSPGALPGGQSNAPGRAGAPTRFVAITDPAYPALLRESPDPPPWLFYRGDLHGLERPAVAVVGARRASRAGLEAAGRIARTLAAGGYTVCSGLALGIDAAAHRGALEGGVTAAVLASGVDRPSPYRHQSLARRIVERGCLLSELPDATAPSRAGFPRRNRIISGLCAATIIVEAALPSGSLHTAAAALEQGRDVYVLPWSVFHEPGAGCLALLRDGATPITDLDELSAHFPDLSAPPALASAPPVAAPPVSVPGRRLLACIGDDGATLDELQHGSGLATEALLATLMDLELGGWLCRAEGRYRRLRRG